MSSLVEENYVDAFEYLLLELALEEKSQDEVSDKSRHLMAEMLRDIGFDDLRALYAKAERIEL